MSRAPRILYITRNGLLEPLGQSQIFPYLRGLACSYRITLISFEKPADYSDHAARVLAIQTCSRLGITWIPLTFRDSPRPWAPLYSVLTLFLVSILQWFRHDKPKLLHARSYVPAAVALLLHWITRVPFIFDMRALWPEELITAGRLRRGSVQHSLLNYLERLCLSQSAGVVSLTHSALGYLNSVYQSELQSQRLVVIPTCVDHQRFSITDSPPRILTIGCIGTLLSGWFLTDWLCSFFDAFSILDPSARFEIVSRDPPNKIAEALNPVQSWSQKLLIRSAPPAQMPDIINQHSASVMFYAGDSVSELGRSPTRLAEVLACGRPVVVNTGVGDVEQLISRQRVGVVARGPDPALMYKCAIELLQLLKAPDLAQRCRQTSRQYFSLETATSSYSQLYGEILSTHRHPEP